MKRVKMPREQDRRVFGASANKTKVINTGKVHMRGGIRL